MIGIYYLR